MEKYTRDVGGYQCLYADTFMSRAEFREMFNHELYDRMRIKVCWDIEGFASLGRGMGKEGRRLPAKMLLTLAYTYMPTLFLAPPVATV